MRVCFTLPLLAAALAGCSMVPGSSADRSTRAESDRWYSDPVVQPVPSSQGLPAVQRLPTPPSAAAGQCLSKLGQAGADYSPLPDRYIDQGCTNLGTVRLAALAADHSTLAISNLGPVTCEVSQVFAAWARFGVDRAARQILGSGLQSIETMGSYSCRNVAGTDRRSGHATGAAIDVSGFVLDDGRRITVTSGWNGGSDREREFLRVVRKSACKRFATVLSPDYNSAHHDHLHVEGVIGSSSYCR